MRNFHFVADGIDVLPLCLELYRQPELWDEHTERTRGTEGSFTGTSDIWVRFRAREELTSRESFAEPFIPVFYRNAWDALPHLRPLVFGLMARCEAVQLGGVLITRIGPGQQVKPHHDKGRWHSEFFNLKVYIPLATNDRVVSTCADESIVMSLGSAWAFPNTEIHSTVNGGETDRITLITCLRVE